MAYSTNNSKKNCLIGKKMIQGTGKFDGFYYPIEDDISREYYVYQNQNCYTKITNEVTNVVYMNGSQKSIKLLIKHLENHKRVMDFNYDLRHA